MDRVENWAMSLVKLLRLTTRPKVEPTCAVIQDKSCMPNLFVQSMIIEVIIYKIHFYH